MKLQKIQLIIRLGIGTIYTATMDNLNNTLVNHSENVTSIGGIKNDATLSIMAILQSIIASLGIITNLTVVIVFFNHKKLRRKIPNIFITNQVS